MTIWRPDTCACIADLDNNILLERCRTHSTVDQVLAHNRSFNLRNGRNPTRPQEDQQRIDKDLETKKPEFQRR